MQVNIKKEGTTVTTALIELVTFSTHNLKRVGIEIAITLQTFDQFQILGQFGKGGSFVILYSAAADYTSPGGAIVDVSGDLTILAAGNSGWFIMDVEGIDQIKLKGACATTGGLVNVYGTGD